MTSTMRAIAVLALATGALASCSTAPATSTEKDELTRKAQAERQEWNQIDPSMEAFAKKAYGFAFFPEVTKGGLGIGGAYGRGVVFEQGQQIGYADVTQGSIGLQAGGQTYSELIVFENKAALDRFKLNQTEFSANASAVVAKSGAALNARFVNGVAVFVKPTNGVMAEATLGGQRTSYVAK